MILSAGTRLGPYEILSLIGSGGMGEVYRARDTRLGRDVAVKILPPTVADNPSRRARFLREAQAISQLNHPHICAVYDVGRERPRPARGASPRDAEREASGGGVPTSGEEDDAVSFLVMEFIDGETLEHKLRLGRIAWTTAVTWTMQVASALDAAHRRGIVHRDLKPANIMLAESGVKLLDFGIAKLLEDSDAAQAVADALPTASLTAERTMVGTLQYMSPEQLEGKAIDGRSDIFSLGATLYEMLTARKAFEGSSPASVTAAILTTEPPAIATLTSREAVSPPALDHVVRRALAKDPDERWQTARDFMIELRSLQDSGGRPMPVAAASRRRAIGLVAGLGIAVLAGVGATTYWAGTRRAVAPTALPIAFTISPPQGSVFSAGFGNLAVTRDGRRVAFVAGPAGSPGLITSHDLRTGMQRVLAGTDAAVGIFWSPTGEWIGYFSPADGKIKRVAALGGIPEAVADAKVPSAAASWGDDDLITFLQKDGQYRVKASGGPIQKVSETFGAFPQSLPGGRLMFLVNGTKANASELRVEGAGLREPVLLPVDSNAVYAGGYLVHRRGETLLAQPIDPHAVTFTGPAAQIAENVSYNPRNGRTVFDASDTVVVFRTAADSRMAWRDRTTGKFLGTVGEGRDQSPALAPDSSQRVAVDRWDPKSDTFHIWVIDAFARSTQLSRGLREIVPIWSPDAEWIAFTSVPGGQQLRRVRASGEGAEEPLYLNTEQGVMVPQDYTKDYLIFTAGSDLRALPLQNGAPIRDAEPIRLTDTPGQPEAMARVSPNGRWLAYTVGPAAQRQVWVQDMPAGKIRHQITTGGGFAPRWRQDGKELYYIAPGGGMMAVPVLNDSTLTRGTPKLLFPFVAADEAAGHQFYGVSPDGQRFLVHELTGAPEVINVIVNWKATLR
jgi:Tol biopolymer transport system component